MAKFKITVTDDHGNTVYDEAIKAAGPIEAFTKAVTDAKAADVSDPEWRVEGGAQVPFTKDT